MSWQFKQQPVASSNNIAFLSRMGATEDTNTQTLRDIHDRLLTFIAAHSALSKATLGLADAIVEFYSPEDDGFAPAVAFQTIAAEGLSGMLSAQIQALVQAALRPLGRFTAEMGEVEELVKTCKEAGKRSQHYAKKVNELNTKLGTEKREDKRAVLKEKAARNNAKLAEAHRERNDVSEKVYRLVDSSLRSSYACFNPVFASICQFQEATYSHAHMLSAMLLRVVRASLGSASLPMAAADAPLHATPPTSPFPSSRPARIPSSPLTLSPLPPTVQEEVEADLQQSFGSIDASREGSGRVKVVGGEEGADTAVRDEGSADETRSSDVGNDGAASTLASVPETVEGGAVAGVGSDDARAGTTTPTEAAQDTDGKRKLSEAIAASGEDGAGTHAQEVSALLVSDAAPAVIEADVGGVVSCSPPSRDSNASPFPPRLTSTISETSSAPQALGGGGGEGGEEGTARTGDAQEGTLRKPDAVSMMERQSSKTQSDALERRLNKQGLIAGGGLSSGLARGAFLEGHLPWRKRRRMSGMLSTKGPSGGRGSASIRQMFCVAEGPELVMFNSENDPVVGVPPRSRLHVKGVRAVPAGRGEMELEVTVTDETSGLMSQLMLPKVPSSYETGTGLMGMQPLIEVRPTRVITLVAPRRREHERWALALDDVKGWREEVELETLLEELELSLPFREAAFRQLRQQFSDARISDILGVTAAKNNPEIVLKSSTFDARLAVAMAAATSPQDSINGSRSGQSIGNSSGGRASFGGIGAAAAAAAAAASAGGGNNRRVSSGPGTSFRTLLSRFDSTRSPRENAAFSAAMTGPIGGEGAYGGGGAGGGAKVSRWNVGARARKRGLGGTKSPVGISGVGHITGPSSRFGGGGGFAGGFNPRSPMREGGRATASGRRDLCVELGSPLRRQMQGDANGNTGALLSASFGGDARNLNDSGGSMSRGSRAQTDPDEQAAAVGGDFIGGGHVLCRLRSTSSSSITCPQSGTIFEVFPQLSNIASPDTVHSASSSSARGGHEARQASRERILILELLQEARSATNFKPGDDHGVSRTGTNFTNPAAMALAVGVDEASAMLAATQSMPSPYTPGTDAGSMTRANEPWDTAPGHFVPSGVDEVSGAGVGEGCVGVGVATEGEPLQRRSSFNPYVAKKQSKSPPGSSTPSAVEGVEGDDVSNADLATSKEHKLWGVWSGRDSMPALPPNRHTAWSTGPATSSNDGGNNGAGTEKVIMSTTNKHNAEGVDAIADYHVDGNSVVENEPQTSSTERSDANADPDCATRLDDGARSDVDGGNEPEVVGEQETQPEQQPETQAPSVGDADSRAATTATTITTGVVDAEQDDEMAKVR